MQADKDTIRMVRIEKVIDESKSVRSFIFKDGLSSDAIAGQFLMVWIPSIDELPMSVMVPYDYSNGYSAISVRKQGYSSTALYSMEEGEYIGVRGPYGRGFSIKDGNILLVGGGTGLVPLLRLCKQARKARITLIMGARSKDEVIYEQLARSILKRDDRIIITTDDGSYGVKGFATDAMQDLLAKEEFDMIYTCGPEKMMYKVIDLADRYGIDAEASLERIMKCGIGLCSSCCLGKYILCKDGPVLSKEEILASKEFGRYYRDKSGMLKPIG